VIGASDALGFALNAEVALQEMACNLVGTLAVVTAKPWAGVAAVRWIRLNAAKCQPAEAHKLALSLLKPRGL
jgi:cell division protein FtsW (lipid II flippase)